MSIQYLQVNGAKLYFEVEGKGSHIVFISGANGDGNTFKPLRNYLKKYFTVVLYDRRGHFKSELIGPQDYSKCIDNNVEDLYKLMTTLTKEKFIVFSISGSGAVMMNYLIKYPETVLKVFAHEILLNYHHFPNGDQIYKEHHYMCHVYKNEDKGKALVLFGKFYFNESDYRLLIMKQKKSQYDNWRTVFEHELLIFGFTNVDINLVIPHRDKLVFMQGEDDINCFVAKPVNMVAKSLNKEVLLYPGGHIGYYTKCESFATKFIKLCRSHSLIMDQQKL